MVMIFLNLNDGSNYKFGLFLCPWEFIIQLDMCSFMPQKVFKNHGASAGASMSHSHSQIIALPVVPPAVSARIVGMKEYFERTGKCNLCQIPENDLLINESVHYISVVPFAASFPFEIWIIPRYHSSYFHELDNEKVLCIFLSLPSFIYI